MCKTLSAEHEVELIVADGLGDQYVDRISIIDVGKASGRLGRFFKSISAVKLKAQERKADLYHLHDPELLTIAMKLKRATGAIVVFDAHEDVPLQLMDKPWIPSFLRGTVANCYSWYEKRICRRLDAVVSVTPIICERYKGFVRRVRMVANFPMKSEFERSAKPSEERERSAVYVGGLTPSRGAKQMVEAAGIAKIGLHLAGPFSDELFEKELRALPGWRFVTYHGVVDRQEVSRLLDRSSLGLVTLQATRSYREAYPIKMFEYMASGLPFVASDFPLWNEIVCYTKCGVMADPSNPQAIAGAMLKIIDKPEVAHEMGRNGRKAVAERFNWEREAMTLLTLYSELAEERNTNV